MEKLENPKANPLLRMNLIKDTAHVVFHVIYSVIFPVIFLNLYFGLYF